MSKMYLSGPMTKRPNYREEFSAWEEVLREWGYDVFNPVYLSDYMIAKNGLTDSNAWDKKYRNLFLKEDVKSMLECDEVLMLPDWKTSRGAKLEHKVAKLLGMKINYVKVIK